MNARVAAGCAYASLALLCAGAVLRVPEDLMGLPRVPILFSLFFVFFVWLSAFVIARPMRLAAIVAATTLVASLAMHFLIGALELKETYDAVWMWNPRTGQVFDGPAGPYELGLYVLAGMLMFAAIMTGSAQRPDPPAIAKALLIWEGGLVVLAVIAYFTPLHQFLTPLGLMFGAYVGPLLASAIAVLVWDYVARLKPFSRSNDA